MSFIPLSDFMNRSERPKTITSKPFIRMSISANQLQFRLPGKVVNTIMINSKIPADWSMVDLLYDSEKNHLLVKPGKEKIVTNYKSGSRFNLHKDALKIFKLAEKNASFQIEIGCNQFIILFNEMIEEL